jgi:hypothetical protein
MYVQKFCFATSFHHDSLTLQALPGCSPLTSDSGEDAMATGQGHQTLSTIKNILLDFVPTKCVEQFIVFYEFK